MIELKDISKRFNKTQALKGVNVKLQTGLITALIGKNGSGKSTFINILTGLIQKFEGAVHYNEFQQTDINLASESFGFPSYYKASKVLKVFKVLKNTTDENVDYWVQRLKLTEHFNKPINDLSQGNKQRLNIACAVMGNPKIIIFDEPNNGLDPSGVVLLREIVLQLKSEGKTILIASHLLNELESVSDQVIFLDDGQLIYNDDKSKLVDQYGSLEAAYLAMIED